MTVMIIIYAVVLAILLMIDANAYLTPYYEDPTAEELLSRFLWPIIFTIKLLIVFKKILRKLLTELFEDERYKY